MMADTTFVEGRSAEKARELLKKAEEAGLPTSSVRTTSTGYLVPTEIVDGVKVAEEPDRISDDYDPAYHSVDEVEAYLASTNEVERERVLEAERNGKARKSLVGDTNEEQN